ncbi:hypothetical protein C1H46_006183 [Malus baccata]|uniref:Uncharacterized protein n=1 Tax=Malus baccata TaxID=106549 RepID=A0A540NAZ0_MALBA|nr:hypothetical protein C1H46_006183 [Malus baccata]
MLFVHTLHYDGPFVVPPILKNLVGQTKTFQLTFGNQNNNFEKIDFIIHGLLQDQALSNPAIASIKPQTPAPTIGKQIINQVTPTPLTPSQPLDQEPQSVAAAKTSKRTLFPDQANKSDSKQAQPILVGEFHNLVVPKIEHVDKVPIAALKTKTQAKKNKDR